MISGAFVLHSKDTADYKTFYLKSWFKIVVPFLEVYGLWMIVYGVKALFVGDVYNYIGTIFKGTYGNLWFMPMLIGLYFISPLIVKLKGDKQIPPIIGIIILIWAIVSQSTSEYVLPYSLGVVGSYLAFFIVGNILYEAKIKWHPIIYMIGVMTTSVIATWWRCLGHQFYSFLYYRAFFSPLVVTLSIFVFLLFKGMPSICSDKKKKVEWVSSKTYYIYLLHTPIWIMVRKLFDYIIINELGKLLIEIVIVFVLTFIVAIVYTGCVGRLLKSHVHNCMIK